ncbi:MAG: hypothetical protein HYX41_07225, partial [Bdellovibrio sp.]|nr:hypothetical protein [Bdellovibrio sp.]
MFHILMDYWNNYGVHPFSPFWNRWYYGDRIFIVEPLFWFCLLPLVFQVARSAWWRALCLGLGVFMLGLVWSGIFAPTIVSLAVTLFALLLVYFQKRFSLSPWVSITGVISILVLFGKYSHDSHSRLENYLRAMAPQADVIQLSAGPAPSNPFCWQFSALTIENQKDYVGRTG